MAEKDTSRLLILKEKRCSDLMAYWLEAALFSLEEVGMRVQIPPWQLPFFFSFIVFLPFGFLLFILTADPFSFARFLRISKRISSNIHKQVRISTGWRQASWLFTSSDHAVELRTLKYKSN